MSTAFWWYSSAAAVPSTSGTGLVVPATVAAVAGVPAPQPRGAAGTLLTPTVGVIAVPFSPTQISLNWAGVDGASRYDVERDGVIIQAAWPSTTLIDSGLTAGVTYTYRVRPKP